jgi:hypothetical protein
MCRETAGCRKVEYRIMGLAEVRKRAVCSTR